MKAWQVSRQGDPAAVMSRADVAIPTPSAGEVQIRVTAAGLGLPDVLMCRGEYLFAPPVPFTPGQEVAGEITAVAAGSRYVVGDRVLAVTAFYNGHGGYAEYCLAPEGAVYAIPQGMSDAEAAGFGIPFHTAWVGLCLRGGLRAGDTVMVLGAAGSSGAAAIRLCRALGATVIAAAGSEAKRQWCLEIGAHHAVDSRAADLPATVLALTEGGVDLVYDPVGGEALEQAPEYCAPGSRLLAVGFASGRWGQPSTETLVLRHCALVGVYVGACTPQQMSACHAALTALYTDGKLNVGVASDCGFDDIPQRLDRLARRDVIGKQVAVIAD